MRPLPFPRRFFTLFAALVVMVSGCQSSGEQPVSPGLQTPAIAQNPTPAATATQPVPTATPEFLVPLDRLEGLTVSFSYPWVGELADAMDTLVAEFNQTNPWGILVEGSSAGSSMMLAQLVEEPPEVQSRPQVVIAPSEHLLTWLERDGLIRPLNDLIADPVMGLAEQQRVNYPLVFWQQDQASGLQAGIPVLRDAPVLYYNQTWAEELGFTAPPATLEAFREQSCAAADAVNHDQFSANNGTGGWIVNTDGLVVYSWLLSFGFGDALSGDPQAFQFNQPAAETTFRFFRSMIDEGCIWFARSSASNEYFANRQALMYTGSLTDLDLQANTQARLQSTDKWTVLPFPNGDRPVTVTSGLSIGVLKSTPEMELASWLFVRWMSQPVKNAQILAVGGGLPVTDTAAVLVADQIQASPLWGEVIEWVPEMRSVPTISTWDIARFVLQDAFWQALQSFTRVEDIPGILTQLDATIVEVEAAKKP